MLKRVSKGVQVRSLSIPRDGSGVLSYVAPGIPPVGIRRGLRCDIRTSGIGLIARRNVANVQKPERNRHTARKSRGSKVSTLHPRYRVAVGAVTLSNQNKINANTETVVAEAMANIDAEYEALCAEYANALV